jgi:predicted ATPase
MFADVDTEAVGGGAHRLRYQDRWNDKVWYTPDEVSDGTILLTAFLTLQFQEPPLDLLCIEEPERGVHPHLLGQLVAVLRRMTTGEIGGHRTQIVLATHSPELLEFIEPKEVRLLSRDAADGALQVRTIDAESDDWRTAYREYDESLGGLWLSGGLGGVPAGE